MRILNIRAIIKKTKTVLAVAFGVLLLQASAIAPVKAVGANLYMGASASSVTTGQVVTINFRVNPDGENIDAVTVEATYDAGKLTPKSATLTPGYFNIATDNAVGSGNILFSAANFSPTTTDQLIGSLQFTASVAGAAAISYKTTSFASQTGTGNNVTDSRTGITITVSEPAAPTPAPASTPAPSTGSSSPSTSATTAAGQAVAPVITEQIVQGETEGNPKVLVKTDVATTVEVKYGLTSNELSFSVVSPSSATHEIVIPVVGLSSGATIYYQITATNAAGDQTVGQASSFVLTLPNEQDNVVSALIVRVLDGKTPVAGAAVSLGDNQQGTTDANGEVRFNIIEAGKYELLVKHNDKTTKRTVTLNTDDQIQNFEVQLAGNLGAILAVVGSIFGIAIVGATGYVLWKFILKPRVRHPKTPLPVSPGPIVESSAPEPTVIAPGSSEQTPPVIPSINKPIDTANKTLEQIEQQVGAHKKQ